MAYVQGDIATFGATQIAIGISQVLRVQGAAYQETVSLKYLSGGSLEIVPPQLSGSSTAAGNAWGKGYLVGSSEVIAWRGGAAMYFAATGATAVVQQLIGYTAGATFL